MGNEDFEFSDEMHELAQDIKATIVKRDIAAVVILLDGAGRAELMTELSAASWSCLSPYTDPATGRRGFRFQTTADGAEGSYRGAATLAMISMLRDLGQRQHEAMKGLMEAIEKENVLHVEVGPLSFRKGREIETV